MMRRISTVVLLTLLPALAVAQGDAPDKGTGGDGLEEEVVVTAKRRPQSVYDVAAALSVIGPDDVDRQGLSHLADVGKFVPNLTVTTFGAGSPASAMPFIRGIGLQDHLIFSDPGVSVYVDGVYLGRQIGQNLSLSNIERIEVVRGPQGTLYGRNSIGGAIHIVTRQPGGNEPVRVGAEAGTRSRRNASFLLDQRLSGRAGIVASGSLMRRGGVGRFLNVPDSAMDVGEIRDDAARIVLRLEPTDAFSVLLAADANDGRYGLNPYTTYIDELPHGAPYRAGLRNADVSADPYDSHTAQADQTVTENSARGVSATARLNLLEGLQATVLLSERRSEYRAGLDDDSTARNFLAFPEVGSAEQTTAELQFTGDLARFDYVAGLFQYREAGRNHQPEVTFNGFGGGDFTTNQSTVSRALFVHGGFAPSDGLRLSGGVRLTHDEKAARAILNAGIRDASAVRDWRETLWDLAATWRVRERLMVYAGLASGYQSGAFPARPYCLFADPECLIAGDNITAVNREVGIRGGIGEIVSGSISVFVTDYRNLPYQISTTAGAGFDTRNVILEQRSTGVEWEGVVRLSDAFSVRASLGLIDTNFDDSDAAAPLTPEVTASAVPELTFAAPRGSRVVARLSYSYRGDMYGEPSRDPGRLTRIGRRSLVNVDVSYTTTDGRIEAGVYARNFTDERYGNARLNTGDYLLEILANDPREFGVRWVWRPGYR